MVKVYIMDQPPVEHDLHFFSRFGKGYTVQHQGLISPDSIITNIHLQSSTSVFAV